MTTLRFGIIGSGMIARVIAKAVQQAPSAQLVAVASRREESARVFAWEHDIPSVHADWQALVQADDIDVVYVATPTAGREEICLAVLDNDKHLISEKPFISADSARRIAARAQAKGLAFMDATHFTHHPRTAEVQSRQDKLVGKAQRVNTSFFFPFMDRSNIRFDPVKEPTGAIGDMAWYSMRAIVEYLRPSGEVLNVHAAVRRDPETGAFVGGSGLVVFASSQTSSFDFGYDAGVCQMDLDILGDSGLIQIDDYVLDWKDGFAFDNPKYMNRYTLRQGMASPDEFQHIDVATEQPQAVHLVEHFCTLVREPQGSARESAIRRAIDTQTLLDRYCQAVGLNVE
ncbi:gfo/Idh/MocA family oxidoreductase [Pseudomonas fluvialis]|uniref:Gfo/Idh/MocA family oxidoreductase n=1 Tax=Pseudomonas fluvialis TaxID=1793966 RepID=A0A2I0CLM4_9PSED|nr:Gfo/Idh/MocA family oxidoreductase [Pseudomonas pharmacofabricae]PKF70059.1 gfo/Idh/MocA family oxidoreductase [Pseudomonas pharmacofabricae]